MCKLDIEVKVCLEQTEKIPVLINFINSYIKFLKEESDNYLQNQMD